MPKSTRLGSTEHLFAIQSSTLLPTHSTSNSSKRFYIPKKLRFTLRFFQFIFACFDLFLLDLQDGKLVEGQELSAVVQMAKAVGGVSVGVLLWQGILYVVPIFMKWPSRRLLAIELVGDACMAGLFTATTFWLLRGMGFACPVLKSLSCDRYNWMLAFICITALSWFASFINDIVDLWRGTHPVELTAYEEDAILRGALRR